MGEDRADSEAAPAAVLRHYCRLLLLQRHHCTAATTAPLTKVPPLLFDALASLQACTYVADSSSIAVFLIVLIPSLT